MRGLNAEWRAAVRGRTWGWESGLGLGGGTSVCAPCGHESDKLGVTWAERHGSESAPWAPGSYVTVLECENIQKY